VRIIRGTLKALIWATAILAYFLAGLGQLLLMGANWAADRLEVME